MNIINRLETAFDADQDYYFTHEDMEELKTLGQKAKTYDEAMQAVEQFGKEQYKGTKCAHAVNQLFG